MTTENNPESDFPRAIGRPATSALHAAGIFKLVQLTQMTEREVLKLHGMGPKALGILKATLAEKGLTFREG